MRGEPPATGWPRPSSRSPARRSSRRRTAARPRPRRPPRAPRRRRRWWPAAAAAGTSRASFSPSCASPGKGSRPAFTRSTRAGLTSTPTTSCPRSANCTASGSPIFPRARTAIFTEGRLLRAVRCPDEHGGQQSGLSTGAQGGHRPPRSGGGHALGSCAMAGAEEGRQRRRRPAPVRQAGPGRRGARRGRSRPRHRAHRPALRRPPLRRLLQRPRHPGAGRPPRHRVGQSRRADRRRCSRRSTGCSTRSGPTGCSSTATPTRPSPAPWPR